MIRPGDKMTIMFEDTIVIAVIRDVKERGAPHSTHTPTPAPTPPHNHTPTPAPHNHTIVADTQVELSR